MGGGGQAGDQLVVLEVESAKVCDTGLPEEAELNWKEDKEEALKPCQEIKHVFARTARDSPDVTFLAFEVGYTAPWYIRTRPSSLAWGSYTK